MKYRLKELFTDKLSGEWGDEGSSQAGVKVIRTTNFTNSGKLKLENLAYRQIDNRKVITKRLKHGDIIIEKSGGSPSQPVGRVVFFDIDTDETFLCNNFTAILRPDRAKVFPMYLFYRLFDNHKTGKTLRYQNKTTGIINLKLDHYLNSKIEIPERVEDQIRIATILSKAESLIAQRKESLRLLDELLKSTFLEMFGDPVRNQKGWEKSRLELIANQITDGEHKTPVRQENGIKLLSARNIKNGFLDFNAELDFISEAEYKRISKRCNPEKGDILMSCSGTVGRVAVVRVTEPLSLVRSVALIKVKKEIINPTYLEFLMQTKFFQSQVRKNANTSSQSNIFTGQVKKLPIFIPTYHLQTQFAQIVDKVEALKAHYQTSLKELENLYGSLSQRAFKGEL